MLKFNDIPYVRPDLDEYKLEYQKLIELVSTGNTFDVERQAITDFFALEDKLDSLITICSIRNSIDTKDEFYEAERLFFDENIPVLQSFTHQFQAKLLESKNRKQLEQHFGTLLFDKAEISKKTFSDEIIPDLQQENKLSTEYSKLTASAEIDFEGEIRNLSQMGPFLRDKDRDLRHRASLAVSGFFQEQEQEIDRIYDEMVKVRTEIAKKLGYKNFVQLAYDRLDRTDYTAKEAKAYRDQIYEAIVPIVSDLQERKAKRIGIEDLKSYDLNLQFTSGNPTPKGDRAWQVDKAKKMYHAMSDLTGNFIDMMIDHDLLDLDSKPGKEGGGYCTFIPSNDTPFIFANFNGTSHDVDVLTHEAGHAFQAYMSKDLLAPYRWPTLEAAEIHSMSMEFLAWPYIHEFFIEDTDKYKFTHLAEALEFLPYGVCVDEFQHIVYEQPELTPAERKTAWRNVEKKYLPYKDYDDDSFMEKGTFWFKQGHIFSVPFYYIDYTLAQVVAFQYWVKNQESPKEAFESYVNLCKLGGSKSFTELLESAQLDNPFVPGSVLKIAEPINQYLKQVNDTNL